MLCSLFVHAQQLLCAVVGICSLNLLNYIHAQAQPANDNNGTKTHLRAASCATFNGDMEKNSRQDVR